MKLYRFSPIKNGHDLKEAVEYITKQATKLYFRTTGNIHDELINSLTVFSHYADEYSDLVDIAMSLGESYNENNGPRVKLRQPIHVTIAEIEDNGQNKTHKTTIEYLRIRKPDPYRMQVGCADLEVDFESQDFSAAVAWPDNDKSPRLITRDTYDMLELFNPDIDVLAYVVSKSKN